MIIMDAAEIAAALLARLVENEQGVIRCDAETPVEAIRAEVRRLAKEQRLQVRTGMVDDVLVVVSAQAALWDQPVSVMRSKLTAPEQTNVVR